MERPTADFSTPVEAQVLMPRLYAYYASPTVQPALFLREVRSAVKAARLAKREPPSFDPEDADETLARLLELDPTLSRTVKLLGKEPSQVRRWVTRATRAAFNDRLTSRGLENEPALARFDRFLRSTEDDLQGKDKQRREHAQNLLRLSLPWLVEMQNLKPEEALPLVGRAKRARAKTTDLRRDVRRMLFRVPVSQIMNLSLVSAFYTKALAEEVSARQEAFRKLSHCRDEQTAQIAEAKELRNELDRVAEERDALDRRLAETADQLRGQKELRAIDRTQIKGRSRRFLKERVLPLISDAHDAMEFDPPQFEGARQRLNMLVAAITKELDEPDE